MNTTQNKNTTLPPASRILHPLRRGFTLVELLVVITIISILAALITVAAVGALKAMNKARIKTDINEISSGLDDYKNKFTAYPPNCQTGGTGALTTTAVKNEILNDLKRHIKQIAPRSQESDTLASVLTGQGTGPLAGGISASEAVVFWLGGFSSDPKYPISGEGGPSYDITSVSATDKAKADPIESRKWVYPFDVTRLGPRDSNGYFNGRSLEYKDPRDTTKTRRINFWTYTPAKSDQPYIYFDTSRHPAAVFKTGASTLLGNYDPPAATYTGAGDLASVYAFKKASENSATGVPVLQFINPDKFQVIHCGIDNAWDAATFKKMSVDLIPSNVKADYLLFPSGPFTGEFADTQVNFAVESTIEDSQK